MNLQINTPFHPKFWHVTVLIVSFCLRSHSHFNKSFVLVKTVGINEILHFLFVYSIILSNDLLGDKDLKIDTAFNVRFGYFGHIDKQTQSNLTFTTYISCPE